MQRRAAIALGVGVLAVAAAIAFARHRDEEPPLRVATASAAPSASTSASVAPLPLIDLLRRTSSSIAVSSEVGNGTDLPSHLVDGRSDTAWQSKTGDLVGAWIRFRVPDSAHIERIGIVAGFDAVTSRSGDLFTKNHRITDIVVRRGEAVIGSWHLDSNVRAMQYFDLNEPGGELELSVSGVQAGSEKTWRETCVSELVVLGTSPDATAEDHVPTVDVSVVGASAELLTHEAPCPNDAEECLSDEIPVAPNPFFLELRRFEPGPCSVTWLVIRTARGWYKTSVALEPLVCGDPNIFSYVGATARVEQGVLLVRARRARSEYEVDDQFLPTDRYMTSYVEETTRFERIGDGIRSTTKITATAASRRNGDLANAVWHSVGGDQSQ